MQTRRRADGSARPMATIHIDKNCRPRARSTRQVPAKGRKYAQRGLVASNRKGPPETLQTHSVRMNLRPGNLPRLLVCHSRSCGFFDVWPTMGFFTTASLKWSTTAAMANMAPSRSYRLFSTMVCAACACALSAAANTDSGAAVNASTATALRLVTKVGTDFSKLGALLTRATERGEADLSDCMGNLLLGPVTQ